MLNIVQRQRQVWWWPRTWSIALHLMSGHIPTVQWVGEVWHLAAVTQPAPHTWWPCLTMYNTCRRHVLVISPCWKQLLALSKFKNRSSRFLQWEGEYSDYCQTWSPRLPVPRPAGPRHTRHLNEWIFCGGHFVRRQQPQRAALGWHGCYF